jgi:flagellar biosynthesis protein FlhG
LANYTDQAEGLRRMLAGPRPRIFTFLSALPDEEKNAMLVNLSASLVRAGSDVLLLDARAMAGGVSFQLGMTQRTTLLEVVRQEKQASELMQAMPQGFRLVRLAHGTMQARTQLQMAQHDAEQMRRMTHVFGALAKQNDVVIIDGDLGKDDSFPLQAMTNREIVVQVANNAASIKSAYAIIKRLSSRLGRRPFSVLVTGASDAEAKRVYDNMAQAASRYLATNVSFLGSVPADDHLKRAANLGRTVIEAFPLAGASVAFRRLAGRCALAEASLGGLQLAG